MEYIPARARLHVRRTRRAHRSAVVGNGILKDEQRGCIEVMEFMTNIKAAHKRTREVRFTFALHDFVTSRVVNATQQGVDGHVAIALFRRTSNDIFGQGNGFAVLTKKLKLFGGTWTTLTPI